MEKICEEKHVRVNERIKRNEEDLEKHANLINSLQTEDSSVKENIKNIYKRLDSTDRIVEGFSSMSKSVAVMAEQLKYNNLKTDKLIEDVEIIKNKDGDDYSHYKKVIAGALIGLIITFIIGVMLGQS